MFNNDPSNKRNVKICKSISWIIFTIISCLDCLACDNDVEQFKTEIISEITNYIPKAKEINITFRNNLPIDNLCMSSININEENYFFKVKTTNNQVIQGSFSFKIEIPILKNNISRSSIITHNDLDYAYIENNNSKSKIYLFEVEDIVGKISKSNLYKGNKIRKSDLDIPIMVAKNSQVNIIYEKGNLKLKINAVSLENGYYKQVIKVRNLRSGNIFNVLVEDYGVAKAIN